MKTKKIVILAAIAAAVIAYYALDLGQYLNLQYLKDSQQSFRTITQLIRYRQLRCILRSMCW